MRKLLKDNLYQLLTLLIAGLIFFAPVIFQRKSLVEMSALMDKYPWSETLDVSKKLIHPQIDGVANYYPMLTGCILPSLKNWQLPTWCPTLIGGYPIFANSDARVLSWTNFLYLFLSPERGFSYSIILQFFLLMLFSYAYFRQVKISKWGSTISSLSLSFSNLIMFHLTETWLLHSFIWLPLILLLVERFIKKQKPLTLLAIILFLLPVWYGGHPQIAFYVTGFSWIYFVFRLKPVSGWLKGLVIPTGTFLVVLLLIAWQFLPLFELQSFSHRRASLEPSWISPIRLLTSWWPELPGETLGEIRAFNTLEIGFWEYLGIKHTNIDNSFFIGSLSLLLAIFGITKHKKNRLAKFFAITALTLILGQVLIIFWKPLFGLIPFINRMERSTRINLLAIFGLCYLAGLGFDSLILKAKQRISPLKWSFVFFLISSVLLLITGFVFLLPGWQAFFERAYPVESFWAILFGAWPNLAKHLQITNPNLLAYTGLGMISLLIVYLRQKNMISAKYFTVLVLGVVISASLFFGKSVNNINVPVSQVYPEIDFLNFLEEKEAGELYRATSLNPLSIMYNNTFLAYQMSDVGVEITMYPKWYSEYFTFVQRRNLDVLFDNHLWLTEPKSQLLDMFNVKYFLTSSSKTLDEKKFEQIYANSRIKIFENKRVLPRVWLVSETAYKTGERALEILNSEKFNPLETALINEKVDFPLSTQDVPDRTSQILSYKPSRVIISTQSTANSFLVLADTFYPGWKVTVDNQASTVYRTNYVMRGVYVPAGEHIVEFYYDSDTIRKGFTISATTFIVVFLSFCIFLYKRLKYKNSTTK